MVTFSNNAKKDVVATALASGATHKEAAKLANVTAGTVSVYKKDSAFIAKINEMKLENLTMAQDKFRGSVTFAVDTVIKTMAESQNERVRLDAAKYILDTVRIAPHKEGGLWTVGPTSAEEIESREHEKAMRKRMQEISDELKLPIF